MKRFKQTFDNYHAASSVHNFMLNDTFTDWINYSNNQSVSQSNNRFFNFITEQGNKFENRVITLIKQQSSFIKIAESKEDIRDSSKYKETIKAMNNQIGIIYQGVLHGNDNFKAFGSPDMLIRSDVVDTLFDQKIDTVPKSNGKFNYIVIDIKFCTLKLRADGKFLLNEARMPANKAQVMIYNELLGIAQGYKPRYCYVLGRGWKYTKKNEYFECNRFNERLGTIDTTDKDTVYNQKIKDAFKWLDDVKEKGSLWKYNPPSVPELYPNMSSNCSNSAQKKKIAIEIDEITQMWNCGVKQRKLAHEKGIFKLSDPNLTSRIMGFPQGTKRTKIIDKMLKFNQGLIGKNKPVIPDYISSNPYDWQMDVRIEFFVDFECFSSMFDDFSMIPNASGPGSKNSEQGQMSIVFMTGLGISIKDSNGKIKWEYYNFMVPELTNEHEFEMFDQFYKKIEEKCKEHRIKIENAKIYHWGNIEQSIISKLYIKYEDKHDWTNLCLIDFCKIFQDDAILIKGVYGFGLKSVGKGMIDHGLIKIASWEDNVEDGLDAMVQAYDIYNNPEENHEIIVKNLINYNHTDVRMIEKIINYLRKNHV